MNDTEWREEWSRHYDMVQWTSIYVFTTATVLLLGYAYTNDNLTNPWYFAIGLAFTNLTIYNTAGFRELRNILHSQIKDPERQQFLTNLPRIRKMYMWPAFLVVFFLLDVAWLDLYGQHGSLWSTIVLSVISAGVLGYSAKQGWGAEVDWPAWIISMSQKSPRWLSWWRSRPTATR